MKPVFVIMVTYRRFDNFKQTVESLVPTLPRGSELVIVYNMEGKHESDEQYSNYFRNDLIQSFPNCNVRILDTGTNEGWGSSMNEGLRLYHEWKDFEYVLETNNDVTYDPDWLSSAVACMQEHPKIGILGLWAHPYHGVRSYEHGCVVKDDMPATAWFFRSKDLMEFGPFPEHGPCKTRGGNGEDTGFRDRVQNKFNRWIAWPGRDLAHHMDGYDLPDLGKENAAYL